MNKLLFLDFDGVLHPSSPGVEPLFGRAQLLDKILHGIDIPIVISSSWRFTHSIKELQTKLPAMLAKCVVDITGAALMGKHPRHNEILHYLQNKGLTSDWRALDDSYWEFPSGCQELIRCNPNTGIADKQVKELQRWLSTD